MESGGGSSLYVAGSDGRVSRLDPDTGEIGWTFDVAKDSGQKAVVFSSPVVSVREGRKGESRLIFFGRGLNDFQRGILYCLEERTVEKAGEYAEVTLR